MFWFSPVGAPSPARIAARRRFYSTIITMIGLLLFPCRRIILAQMTVKHSGSFAGSLPTSLSLAIYIHPWERVATGIHASRDVPTSLYAHRSRVSLRFAMYVLPWTRVALAHPCASRCTYFPGRASLPASMPHATYLHPCRQKKGAKPALRPLDFVTAVRNYLEGKINQKFVLRPRRPPPSQP